VLRSVETSLANRAPAEKRADLLAARLMRLGVGATLGTLVVTGSATRAFTVLLVMSCPCATVLAASTAVAAAVANAARQRILVKGGLYLERVGEADCFCFDKTGTVTLGQPRVVEVIPHGSRVTPDRVLRLAAAAEYHNAHPLARAVVASAVERGVAVASSATAEVVLGHGVRARLGADTILVGHGSFLEEQRVRLGTLRRRAEQLAQAGQTALYVARNGRVQGLIGVVSTTRPGTRDVLDWLRQDGVTSLHLISGDAEPVVRSIASGLGFDAYRAPLLPEEKAGYVQALRASGRQVVVVGDGVNDTPAFAKADVGVAVEAGGAEAAVEAADIALVAGDLGQLTILRRLSHRTLRVVEQNHWLAVGTNLVGVFLGATGSIAPALGGALHLVHTLGILLNSSRLLQRLD